MHPKGEERNTTLEEKLVEKKLEGTKLGVLAAKESIRHGPGGLAPAFARSPVLFDNYANAGMIVGQYVLEIKVPGRSNSVIFMISGRRMAV